jgi:hypothetical protein
MPLCIPEETLKQHVAVLGKTGAGKSSALRHIVEHLLSHKKRVCIIDPKGDWWGLKKSADGKSVGFDVIAFGDFKESKATDIPINAQSGKLVAELIVTGNRPCIIGFRGWTVGNRTRFWIDFAQGIYAAKTLGELYLVGDEFHNFAPKGKILSPEAGMCLHWSNTLLGEGRGLGLICLLATQRPQKLHNDVLTQCETLVAMRVIHKADRDAVQDWIEGCGDISKGKEVLNSLAGMARGEAYVWSPEIGFGPKRLIFPMFTTFDSFAPPQLQRKVSDSGWSAVDLDEVRKKLATVIEEAKANDPRELKAEIARLKHEKSKLEKAAGGEKVVTKTLTVKEPVLTASERKRLTKLVAAFENLYAAAEGHYSKLETLSRITNELKPEVTAIKSVLEGKFSKLPNLAANKYTPAIRGAGTVRAERPLADAPPAPPREGNNGTGLEITGPGQRILNSLATWGAMGHPAPSNCQVAWLAGYSPTSTGYTNPRGALKSLGLVNYPQPDMVQLTEEGLGNYTALQLNGSLLDFVLSQLGGPERRILAAIASGHPNTMTNEEAATLAGYSHSSTGYTNPRGALRSKELITYPQPDHVRAAEWLFQF